MSLIQIRRITDLAKAVLAVVIGVVLTLILAVAVSDEPSNRDVYDRQTIIIENQRLILCLLLYPEEARTPAAVAECQTQPEDG